MGWILWRMKILYIEISLSLSWVEEELWTVPLLCKAGLFSFSRLYQVPASFELFDCVSPTDPLELQKSTATTTSLLLLYAGVGVCCKEIFVCALLCCCCNRTKIGIGLVVDRVTCLDEVICRAGMRKFPLESRLLRFMGFSWSPVFGPGGKSA